MLREPGVGDADGVVVEKWVGVEGKDVRVVGSGEWVW